MRVMFFLFFFVFWVYVCIAVLLNQLKVLYQLRNFLLRRHGRYVFGFGLDRFICLFAGSTKLLYLMVLVART